MTKAALLIRYRTTNPSVKTRKYNSYRAIARVLNLTIYEVQHICRKAITQNKMISGDQLARKLDQEHIDFLINPRQLEIWSGLTMKHRTILFHRQFPDKRIAVTSLRRLYLKNGIKRKKVRQEKAMPPNAQARFITKC